MAMLKDAAWRALQWAVYAALVVENAWLRFLLRPRIAPLARALARATGLLRLALNRAAQLAGKV